MFTQHHTPCIPSLTTKQVPFTQLDNTRFSGEVPKLKSLWIKIWESPKLNLSGWRNFEAKNLSGWRLFSRKNIKIGSSGICRYVEEEWSLPTIHPVTSLKIAISAVLSCTTGDMEEGDMKKDRDKLPACMFSPPNISRGFIFRRDMYIFSSSSSHMETSYQHVSSLLKLTKSLTWLHFSRDIYIYSVVLPCTNGDMAHGGRHGHGDKIPACVYLSM